MPLRLIHQPLTVIEERVLRGRGGGGGRWRDRGLCLSHLLGVPSRAAFDFTLLILMPPPLMTSMNMHCACIRGTGLWMEPMEPGFYT